MSSPDRLAPMRLALALLLAASVLGGCNVRPLYTAPATGDTAGRDVSTSLAHVDIAPVEGRVGQKLRNELSFLLHGDNPAGREYVVEFTRVRVRDRNLIVDSATGEPTRRDVSVQVRFELRPEGDSEDIYSGQVTRETTFERSIQLFASDRAKRDAEDRAVRALAEELRLRLAAFFAEGELQPEHDPDIETLEEEHGRDFDESDPTVFEP